MLRTSGNPFHKRLKKGPICGAIHWVIHSIPVAIAVSFNDNHSVMVVMSVAIPNMMTVLSVAIPKMMTMLSVAISIAVPHDKPALLSLRGSSEWHREA
jgi:hypothetical protein